MRKNKKLREAALSLSLRPHPFPSNFRHFWRSESHLRLTVTGHPLSKNCHMQTHAQSWTSFPGFHRLRFRISGTGGHTEPQREETFHQVTWKRSELSEQNSVVNEFWNGGLNRTVGKVYPYFQITIHIPELKLVFHGFNQSQGFNSSFPEKYSKIWNYK